LDMLGIPYTGSGVRAAALTMDKIMAKRVLAAEDIPTPRCMSFYASERTANTPREIRTVFSLPLVVKAPEQGSSIGVYIVTQDEELSPALDAAFSYGDEVLVEEYIEGRELSVVVWGSPVAAETMPIIEIEVPSGRYDYESKYTPGGVTHIVPAHLSDACRIEVEQLARRAYAACGCSGLARVDLLLSTENRPYVIELNAVPGMTETSLVPDAARALGIEFPELCERILALAGYRR
ncbi:MAG: D-alanine--D-alanine ligase, partial [Selenomonas artemidis]|nr:D-alanine--D-alanine ligase [Selenomonas artemidis]